MLEGSVSLTEEAAPEASQYHLHEQIGEGSCEWLPPERAHYSTTPLAQSTDLVPLCSLQLGLSIERLRRRMDAHSSPLRSSAATERMAESRRAPRALLPALRIATLVRWRGHAALPCERARSYASSRASRASSRSTPPLSPLERCGWSSSSHRQRSVRWPRRAAVCRRRRSARGRSTWRAACAPSIASALCT